MTAIVELVFSDDLAKRGGATLDLVRQLAASVTARESELEAKLNDVLTQLGGAEVRHADLSERASVAEKRSNEAEYWLRQLHAKLYQVACGERSNSISEPQTGSFRTS